MADEGREALLRREFHGQTARIAWHELQTAYARGSVIEVGAHLDLVEVAVQLGLDNTAQFHEWIAQGAIVAPDDEQARRWFDENPTIWAVVAPPWVLVQRSPAGDSPEG